MKKTWTGTLEALEFTTFQYGTHRLIINEDDFIALQSNLITLDAFVGKQVRITGNEDPGYPVENGPKLIRVTNVIVVK